MTIVKLLPVAEDDLKSLDRSTQIIVAKALRKLTLEPEKRGLPLGERNIGNLTGYRKLVVGKKQYRIIYRVISPGTICIVTVIGARSDSECYSLALARAELYPIPEVANDLKEVIHAVFRNQ